jgi:hypothetical protein
MLRAVPAVLKYQETFFRFVSLSPSAWEEMMTFGIRFGTVFRMGSSHVAPSSSLLPASIVAANTDGSNYDQYHCGFKGDYVYHMPYSETKAPSQSSYKLKDISSAWNAIATSAGN